jgi:hypothetical protein
MTLQPNFLPVGSVVEYHLMNHNRWTPIRLNATDILNLETDSKHFNTFHRPIKLTPEILTEWCNASNKLTEQYRIKDRLFVFRDGKCFDYGSNTQLDYLHELQLLFLGMKTVLPITIK